MKTLLCLLVLYLNIDSIFGLTYDRYTLQNILYQNGLSEKEVKGLLYIAERGGKFNTKTVNLELNGSQNLGIFQIPEKYCGNGYEGGFCNIKCGDLLSDDIDISLQSALKIYRTFGFEAWPIWKSKFQSTKRLQAI